MSMASPKNGNGTTPRKLPHKPDADIRASAERGKAAPDTRYVVLKIGSVSESHSHPNHVALQIDEEIDVKEIFRMIEAYLGGGVGYSAVGDAIELSSSATSFAKRIECLATLLTDETHGRVGITPGRKLTKQVKR